MDAATKIVTAAFVLAFASSCGRQADRPSEPSLGSQVSPAGTTFTVWAPDATGVMVEGDFNNWSTTANPLANQGSGIFSAEIPGVVAGNHYKYLLITPSGNLVRNDPRALEVTPDLSESIVYDPNEFTWTDSAYVPPAFNQQVIYELHLATYEVVGSAGTGTWASAAAKLSYLAGLGVNMVEVMPPAQFPGSYSWGYNPSYPFAPETNYGSPDEVKTFVNQAHSLGIGVIVDVVHNHWGGGDLPMWCWDATCTTAGDGGVYFYEGALQNTGFGPRPDYGTPEVAQYIVDNENMWLTDYHADGLRWDSVVNIRTANGQNLPAGWDLLQRINQSRPANKIQIAEDLQNYGAITSPVSAGGTGFDSQWDNSFFFTLKSALTTPSDADRDMNAVAGAISHEFNVDAMQRVIYTEDHDQVSPQNGSTNLRIPALIDSGAPGGYYAQKRATLGAAVVLTSPGIPMIFMGQEFLEDLPFPFGQAYAIDWTKPTTFAGVEKMFHRLIQLRTNGAGVTKGLMGNNTHVYHIDNNSKVLGWHRWDVGGVGDDTVIVANFSNVAFTSYTLGFPEGGTWNCVFNGDSTGYMADFLNTPSNSVNAVGVPMDGMNFSGSVGVGPYTMVIFSQAN